MLKREDIVKQFDLLVKQEIKNHNDQILASNISMNKIREDVEMEKDRQEKINASLGSLISKLNSQTNELSGVMGNLIAKLSSLMNDTQTALGDLQSQITLSTKIAGECKAALQDQDKCRKAEKIQIEYLEGAINNIPYTLKAFSDQIEKKMLNIASKIKEEILSIPSEAKELRKEVLSLIDRDRIDFEGVTKELLAVKKAHFINEKKIENLYTLIERINKKLEGN